MPWSVKKRGSKWHVVKDTTGATIKGGVHDSEAEARRHVAAIYANHKGKK